LNDDCEEICGDGLIVGNEMCDNDEDSAKDDLDGCDSNCQTVVGWDCTTTAIGDQCEGICGDD